MWGNEAYHKIFSHGKWVKGVLRQKMLRCWLRKQTDINCINIPELEAVMKSINLDLKCELKENEIKQVPFLPTITKSS